jgi:hypothetical protein
MAPGAMAEADPNLELVRLDRAEVQGVGFIDRGEQGPNWGRVAGMVAGDVGALLAFASIGRLSHGEPLDLEVAATALPFIAGWLTAAPFLGGYGPKATGASVPDAALTALKCWGVGMPLGLVIRGIAKGYVPPTTFAAITLGVTLVLLVGWRAGFALTAPKEEKLTPAQQARARKNKKGNPFEFFTLLQSLTKRW